MKHNKVNIVNGAVVGVHLGAPMQDATPDKPEDNEAYATERNTETRLANSNTEENLEKQPEPAGVGGGVQVVTLTVDENYLLVSPFTGSEIAEMLAKSPLQFFADISGALLPLAFIGCCPHSDGGYDVVLQGFAVISVGGKIGEMLFVIPASSTVCKEGEGDSYTIA